jgi:hypothetical protein
VKNKKQNKTKKNGVKPKAVWGPVKIIPPAS